MLKFLEFTVQLMLISPYYISQLKFQKVGIDGKMFKTKLSFYLGHLLYFLGLTLFMFNVWNSYQYLSLLTSTIVCILVLGIAQFMIYENKKVNSFMNTIKFQLVMASFYLFIAILVGIKVGNFVLLFLLLLMLVNNIRIDIREKKKFEAEN